MKTKHFLLLSIFAVTAFYSCKKKDVAAVNNNGGNNTVVYNVNKQTMLNLVNQARQNGCTCGTTVMPSVAAISWNDQLAKAAYDHSADMKTNNYFSHTSLDGTTPGTRITTAGYVWSTYGENIAMGYPDENAVVTGWLNSQGHCKNIMNKNFKEMGVGKEGSYWTQVFGAK